LKISIPKVLVLSLCVGVVPSRADTNSFFSLGPIFDEFSLTLSSGHRKEAVGPLFYSEQNGTQHTIAVPPLFSHVTDRDVESEEMDILYPLLSYDRYGKEFRFHILQVFSFAGGQSQDESMTRRFTLFPFYFQQRSPKPEENYTAFYPFYGTTKGRFFRDYIHVVMFPIYSETRKRDWVTYNYLFPVFHVRRGEAVRGWQVWPVVGHEHRNPTTRVDAYTEEKVIIPGHDRWFGPWPIFFNEKNNLGTTNEETQLTILPFYNEVRSPLRDMTSYGFPLGVTVIDDREKKYHEIGAPWPIIDFARGSKTIKRVWPFFSQAKNAKQESAFYMWPVYKFNRFQSEPLDYKRTRLMFFLYSDRSERNTETGITKTRKDFWPLFSATRDFEGNERLQVLSILEPLLPSSKSIDRNYSQLWSIWRSEKNAKTGARSQSLLWNLYRRDETRETKKISAFFGLFQREVSPKGKKWRLFFFPVGKSY
jgi:hypothetical protein